MNNHPNRGSTKTSRGSSSSGRSRGRRSTVNRSRTNQVGSVDPLIVTNLPPTTATTGSTQSNVNCMATVGSVCGAGPPPSPIDNNGLINNGNASSLPVINSSTQQQQQEEGHEPPLIPLLPVGVDTVDPRTNNVSTTSPTLCQIDNDAVIVGANDSVIVLSDDEDEDDDDIVMISSKISSAAKRRRLVGTRRAPPLVLDVPDSPEPKPPSPVPLPPPPAPPQEPVRIRRCPVCLDTLDAIDEDPARKLRVTKCGHIFCEDCLKTSLTSAKTCPLCKARIATLKSTQIIFL